MRKVPFPGRLFSVETQGWSFSSSCITQNRAVDFRKGSIMLLSIPGNDDADFLVYRITEEQAARAQAPRNDYVTCVLRYLFHVKRQTAISITPQGTGPPCGWVASLFTKSSSLPARRFPESDAAPKFFDIVHVRRYRWARSIKLSAARCGALTAGFLVRRCFPVPVPKLYYPAQKTRGASDS